MSYRTSRKRKPTADDLVYERDMQTTIRQAANLLGYKVYHTYDSRRSDAGFPDLVICGYDLLMFLELKSSTGKPTAEQTEWIDAITRVQCPPMAQVAYPEDLDRILSILKSWQRL